MLRRVLIAIFILASLSTQASAAFACGMMGGLTMSQHHCCCHDMAAPGAGGAGKGCCDTIIQMSAGTGDQAGHVVSPLTVPDHDPQPLAPALMPAPLALVLPVRSQELAWSGGGGNGAPGTGLYLRTQRLRL